MSKNIYIYNYTEFSCSKFIYFNFIFIFIFFFDDDSCHPINGVTFLVIFFVKDKIQTIYVKSSNVYGIDQIGFPPRQWPEEFNDIFEVDYPKMMEKVVISPLKGMLKAMKMDSLLKWNPSLTASLEYSVDDI